ncbi:MAG: 3-deoxy-7-phosphoheptulonate synthase [Puniceicoccaceae bacterium]
MNDLSDLHIARVAELPKPLELRERISLSETEAAFVKNSRQTIHRIIFGDDPRHLVVVGPCSIHDPSAAVEYATRLSRLAAKVADHLYVVMRVYFEKPRTTVGWKGLIMDPNLDGTADITTGLSVARKVLRDVIRTGLPTATEFLDPITPQYIADLISWAAIGARTSESQTHRQMASGLSMPMGFKNTTAGEVLPAINGIRAASEPQTFLGVSINGQASAVTTTGNPNCHLILRGGNQSSNYDAASTAGSVEMLLKNGLIPAIMVDCSHANSDKNPARQPEVFLEIIRRICAGETSLIGTMIESNLVEGSQPFPVDLDKLTYGKSITDPCIGWETTEAILQEANALLHNR